MRESRPLPPPLDRPSSSTILTLGGLAAAFGAASCCGLPLVLASLGLGSGWFTVIGLAAGPYRPTLLALGILGLAGGGYFFWRQTREAACSPNAFCARPSVRLAMVSALLIGSALLYLGYAYA